MLPPSYPQYMLDLILFNDLVGGGGGGGGRC